MSSASRPVRWVAAGLLPVGLLVGSGAVVVHMAAHPVVAHADEVEDLIAEVDHLSHEAGAKNEEVKDLEVKIDEGQKDLDNKRREIEEARVRADEAQAAERALRAEVDVVASAKYRGSVIDPITNALGASNPQGAIDRASYLTTLARRAENAVNGLAEATERAARAHNDASRAAAQAEHQLIELKKRHEELDKERQDLDHRMNEVKQRVDSLSAADRQRWVEKNGPFRGDLHSLSGASDIVDVAMTRLGAPYGWGATGPDVFDCSGLVQWSYAQRGISIPRTSQAQIAGGTPVSYEDLQPGDVVGFYPGVTHVGIYAGDGMVVHASDYGIPVQVVPLNSMPFAGAARY